MKSKIKRNAGTQSITEKQPKRTKRISKKKEISTKESYLCNVNVIKDEKDDIQAGKGANFVDNDVSMMYDDSNRQKGLYDCHIAAKDVKQEIERYECMTPVTTYHMGVLNSRNRIICNHIKDAIKTANRLSKNRGVDNKEELRIKAREILKREGIPEKIAVKLSTPSNKKSKYSSEQRRSSDLGRDKKLSGQYLHIDKQKIECTVNKQLEDFINKEFKQEGASDNSSKVISLYDGDTPINSNSAMHDNVIVPTLVTTSDGLPSCTMFMNDRWIVAKIDTCAKYAIAAGHLAKYGRPCLNEVDATHIEGISGGKLRITGVRLFTLKSVNGDSFKVKALIVEACPEEFLLGMNFFVDYKVHIDFETAELRCTCSRKMITIPFEWRKHYEDVIGVCKSTIVEDRKLEGETRNHVTLEVNANDGIEGLFVPSGTFPIGLMIAPTLTRVTNGKVVIPVLNTTSRKIKLPTKQELGSWVPVTSNMEILEVTGSLSTASIKSWIETLSKDTSQAVKGEDHIRIDHLDDYQQLLLVKLLRCYPKVVTKCEGCPPLTKTGVEHYINTEDHAPIFQKRLRNATSENETIKEHVEKMLAEGVIEESNGPWGFPVVLVKKKDGEVRFCIDYRALNAITVKDVYPLPRIDETIDSMGGSQWFTTLDLKSGYWQLALKEEDRDKTAFTTRQGLFRFQRMPFGLCNAPGTFQRMMDCTLRGLLWICCLVYLDDVIIYTKGSFERHMVELAVVLERLAIAGLTLKPAKCEFASKRLEFLGHELTPEGVRPLQRIVDAVRDFPTPKDANEVRRFVHLAGYYRKFIPKFGTKMSSLTKLLRKDNDWQWTSEQQRAFKEMKKELTSYPVLTYPDFNLPFTLVTDASTIGLGAALMQEKGHGMQAIAYASKVNNDSQSKYSITKLECLAIVWAIKVFRPYLYGRKFKVVTDHAALRWLMNSSNLTGMLHRWALTLQEYDFEIVYRPGSTNVVADALSRSPTGTADGELHIQKKQWELDLLLKTDQHNSNGLYDNEQFEPSIKQHSEANTCNNKISIIETSRYCGTDVQSLATATEDNDQENNGQNVKKHVHTVECNNDDTRVDTLKLYRLKMVVQLTNDVITKAQKESKLCAKLIQTGVHHGMAIETHEGITYIITGQGRRIVLPPALWAIAFKECHGSIWSGHLRLPQTLDRLRKYYWWPNMEQTTNVWITMCQECGSRKARPRKVIPPLRPLSIGFVGERWVLDIAGPLPVTAKGNRYVVAAIEWVSKYAVAVPIQSKAAVNVAQFLITDVIFKFGPFRTLFCDNAPEFIGSMVNELVQLLQAKQHVPIPYRPNLVGIIERFNRTWKDMVALYVNCDHNDWDEWLPSTLYAYNSAVQSTTKFQPAQLMFGRQLPLPSALLRLPEGNTGDINDYHAKLMETLRQNEELARVRIARAQVRQAIQYNRRVRNNFTFRSEMLVWVHLPPRGRGTTKFKHQWRGPGRLIEDIGYDNWRVMFLDTQTMVVAHISQLVPFHHHNYLTIMQEVVNDWCTELMIRNEADGNDGISWIREAEDEERISEDSAQGGEPLVASQWNELHYQTMHQASDGSYFKELSRKYRRDTKSGKYEPLYNIEYRNDNGFVWRKWLTRSDYDALWTSTNDEMSLTHVPVGVAMQSAVV